MIIEVIIKY